MNMDNLTIEEFVVKTKYRERKIMQFKDDLVLDETPISKICEDGDIQQETLQQKTLSQNCLSNKVANRKEINKEFNFI